MIKDILGQEKIFCQELIQQFFLPQKGDKNLLVNPENGQLLITLANKFPNNQFFLYPQNSFSLTELQELISTNQLDRIKIISKIPLGNQYQSCFDNIIINGQLFRGRSFYRRLIIEGYDFLKRGGQFWLVGNKNQGVKSAAKDISSKFNNQEVLAYRKGNRLIRARKTQSTRTSPKWENEPGIKPNSWYKIKTILSRKKFSFHTLPGVFSYKEVDEGTKMLLKTIKNFANKDVLDWGCGYGIIGIFLAKLGAAWVDMTDIDLLAIASSRKNIQINQINNAHVFAAKENLPKKKYDLIISNPPFHSGKEVSYQATISFLKKSRNILKKRGKLIIVANQFIPYEKELAKTFPKTKILKKNKKYKIIESH
jgi:16S rRNA (guanine1207-N2)-methyltransferase